MALLNSLSQMGDRFLGAWGRRASLPVSPVGPTLRSSSSLPKVLSSVGPSLSSGLDEDEQKKYQIPFLPLMGIFWSVASFPAVGAGCRGSP